MACIVMAYIVVAFTVMANIGMAYGRRAQEYSLDDIAGSAVGVALE